VTIDQSVSADDAQLRTLGYDPVLHRRLSWFGSHAVSFSVISILSGCMTLFGYGMATGGPVLMVWGWVIVGGLVLLVGLGLAEVTSVYPTSGGLFFMAGALARKHGRAWSWFTGWLNLLGLLGTLAGIDFGAAQFIGALASLQWGFHPTAKSLIGIYALVLALHALLNLPGIKAVAAVNKVSVWWHLGGVALIVAVLVVVPAHHQPASFVFGHYVNGTGIHSAIYVTGIGLLMAAYTFTGFDASCHLSEETDQAARSAPRGIVHAVAWSWAAGLVLILGLVYAIQDYTGELGSSTGEPPAQIFLDALGLGWARMLMLVVVIAQLCCGHACVNSASRMTYAFSRDGALPGSSWWRKVSRRQVPVNAVLLTVLVAFGLALPYLWNPAAYAAVTAIGTVGLALAYGIPIFLRVRQGRRFQRGAWHLGRAGMPVGILACSWLAISVVLFCLPQTSPITVTSFNYAPVALAAALLIAGLWWLVGRRHYQDPNHRVSAGHRYSEQLAEELT
jgi:amino acid transporter